MNSGTIILLVVVVLLCVAYPIIMVRRNKKDQERQRELISSLKIGEYVLTYSGIFGKITEIVEKEVGKLLVIETGEKRKNYVTVSENAIYSVVTNKPKVYTEDGDVLPATPEKLDTPSEEKTEDKAEKKTEKKVEAKTEKKAKKDAE